MRVRKRRAQNIEKKGRISMAKVKEYKIEKLGNKICRLVSYYEKGKGQNLALAALADVLMNIKEVFKSYDERFKRLEKRNLELREINKTDGITNIKLVGLNQAEKRERR